MRRTGPFPARTLVVTGGWSTLFDEVAESMVKLGAEPAVVPGHGHRPQDDDSANDLLRDFWAS